MTKSSALFIACSLLFACEKATDTPPSSQASAAEVVGEKAKSACELDTLDAFARELKGVAPMRRRDLVAQGLPKACSIPSSFSDFFEATTAQDVRKTRLGSPSSAGLQTNLACPQWEDVSSGLPALPAAERVDAVFKGCDLARLDLIEGDAWRDVGSTSLVPFAAAAWLKENGASESTARTVAQAMLLRDRRIWSKPDQALVATAYPLPPVPRGPVVFVDNKAIEIDGQEVGPAEPIPGTTNRWTTLLGASLAEQAKKSKTVLLVADTSRSTVLIRQLVSALGEVGFSSVALVAANRPLEFGAAVVRPNTFATTTIRINAKGLSFMYKGKVHDVLPKNSKDGLYDYAELAKALKGTLPVERLVVSIAVDSDVSTEAMLNTISAVYDVACGGSVGECTTPPKIGLQGSVEEMATKAGLLGMIGAEGDDIFGSSGLGSADMGEAIGGLSEVGGDGLVEGTMQEGLIGSGFGGSREGSTKEGGAGAGFGGGGKTIPRVRQRKAEVGSGLDRDIVRRIVRAHINEIRSCYETALEDDEKLEDLVTLSFTVTTVGKVESASAVSRESNKDLAKCVAKAAGTWKFPRPSSAVEISYPFELSLG